MKRERGKRKKRKKRKEGGVGGGGMFSANEGGRRGNVEYTPAVMGDG